MEQLEAALREMANWGPLRCSSFYRTEPLGDPNQPWYVNAAAELETPESPVALLGRLRLLEQLAGRPPDRPRWTPRLLDLDLLLLGDVILNTPELRLPHQGFHLRRFVLQPLAELAPEVRDPRSGISARELLRTLDDPLRVEKLFSIQSKSGSMSPVEVQPS